MDKFNWDILGRSMRVLFSKYDLEGIKDIGSNTQKLESSVFIDIIYHLILMIDPVDCRRKFRQIYPVKNQEETSKFFEKSVKFINDSQLISCRTTTSQLKICGGPPVRRLISNMIERAAESELARILNSDTNLDLNQEPEDLLRELESANQELGNTLTTLREESCRFKSQSEKAIEIESEISECIEPLMIDVFGKSRKVEASNLPDIKDIEKVLLERLENCCSRFKEAEKKIQETPSWKKVVDRSEALNISTSKTPRGKRETKRMSQYFKEIRKRLSQSPKSFSNIVQRLLHCENGLDNLITKWQADLDVADELLLLKPELAERYKFFEKYIPLIDIKPLNLTSEKCDTPDTSEIVKILSEYDE